MCGLCGLFHPSKGGLAADDVALALRRMTRLLAPRGPDDEELYADPTRRLRLGFRRLAIVDLSGGGKQPRISAGGGSVLAFNGEIYNFRELRAELQGLGRRFSTDSDSEVLIEALEQWGLAALPRLRGMFALAWFELGPGRLTLARDHFGIKPLVWAEGPEGALAFGSQYDLFWHLPWPAPAELDAAALRLYLQLGHLPAPYGLKRGTHQLEPGGYLQVDGEGRKLGRFWRPEQVPTDPGAQAEDGAFDALFEQAVDRHRIADVPLGVFLSGGVDSPLVAAEARGQVSAALPAYTLGNPGWGQDETVAARRYAEALELDHRVLAAGGEAALGALDDLLEAQREPFADFSALPTYLLARFARQGVKVALSGDGGDELFFGYQRPLSLVADAAVFDWPQPWRQAYWLARRAAAALGGRRAGDAILFEDPGAYYFAVNARLGGDALARLAPGLPALPADFAIYRQGRTGDRETLLDFARHAELAGQLQRGLKKVDLASMACGLEVRVPLLDLDLAEWALRLPAAEHLAGGERKALLVRALRRRLPQVAPPSTKLGFGIPLGELLRGPLRARVEERLLGGELFPTGLFARPALEAYWREHQSGRADHKWGLWAIFCLQEWAARHRGGRA